MAKGPKVGPVVATQKQPVLLNSTVDMSPIAIVDIGVWDLIRFLGRSKSFFCRCSSMRLFLDAAVLDALVLGAAVPRHPLGEQRSLVPHIVLIWVKLVDFPDCAEEIWKRSEKSPRGHPPSGSNPASKIFSIDATRSTPLDLDETCPFAINYPFDTLRPQKNPTVLKTIGF